MCPSKVYGHKHPCSAARIQGEIAGRIRRSRLNAHRTLFWLESLAEMGTPQPGISADTAITTYLDHNTGSTPKTVRFPDGTELLAQARSLARVVRNAAGR